MTHEQHRRRSAPGKSRRQKQRGRMVICPNCEATNGPLQGRCWRCNAELSDTNR